MSNEYKIFSLYAEKGISHIVFMENVTYAISHKLDITEYLLKKLKEYGK
jgi:Skp family chaperone for outer membrane proteins